MHQLFVKCKVLEILEVPVPKIYNWWWDVQELRETSRVCTAVKDERTKKPFWKPIKRFEFNFYCNFTFQTIK